MHEEKHVIAINSIYWTALSIIVRYNKIVSNTERNILIME